VARAVGWLVAMRWVGRGLGIFRTLILSSILLPEDFGRAILALSIVFFVEAITEPQVNYTLIRSREDSATLFNAAWTIQIIRGLICGVLVVVCAPLIGSFYGDPLLVGPLYLLGLAIAVGGFANVGMAQFFKAMDFRTVFLASVSSRAAALIVAVVVALVTKSFWAILVGYLTQRIFDVALSFLLHPRRPKLGLKSAGEIGEHSKWLILQGILFQIWLRADVFVIGKIAGPAALGPYYLAKMIAELIGTELGTALRVALFSRFLRPAEGAEAGDAHRVSFKDFSDAALVSVTFGAPFSVLLGLCAGDVIRFFLASEWSPAAGFLQFFAVGAFFGVAAAAPAAVVLAAGHTRLIAFRQAVGLAIFVPTLWFGIETFGLQGAALAVVLTMMSGSVFSFVVAMREVEGNWTAILKDFLRIVFALAALAVVVLALGHVLPAGSYRWDPLYLLRLVSCGIVGLVVYATVLRLVWQIAGKPQSFEQRAGDLFLSLFRKLMKLKK